MYFLDAVPVVFGQADEAVADAQLVFAHHLRAALAQQFVVVQQAARDGVLYGQHPDGMAVLPDGVEYLFEGGAADEFDVLALEVAVCRDVVVGTQGSLDGYSFHITSY